MSAAGANASGGAAASSSVEKGILPVGRAVVKPVKFQFSPDGAVLSCLHSKEEDNMHQLFTVALPSQNVSMIEPPTSGDTEENLSHEEQLRRERQRQMSVGITNYQWTGVDCPGPKKVMVVSQGNIFVGVCETTASSPATQTIFRKLFDKSSTGLSGGAIDPHFSPDGSKVAFVQDSELFVLPVDAGGGAIGAGVAPVQLTFGARAAGKTNGLADFIAQEEMDRYRGFWWSPDSSRIAFIEVDESHIPEFQIMHQGKDRLQVESHRYPFAGAANARVRLGVVTVPTDLVAAGATDKQAAAFTPQWLHLDPVGENDFYLARVDWLVDATLVAQIQNRAQDVIWLVQYDLPPTKASADTPPLVGRVLVAEKAKHWTNLHNNLRSFTRDGKVYLLWTSELDGFMHIYLYSIPAAAAGGAGAEGASPTYSTQEAEAKLEAKLTWGEWVVEDIVGVDATERGLVYFTSTAASPLERHLFAVPMFQAATGSEPVLHRLTHEPGMHDISMSNDCTFFVDEFSSLSVSPQATLYAVQGGKDAESVTAVAAGVLYYKPLPQTTRAPDIVSFQAADAKSTLYGAVYTPDAKVFGEGPYPTIVWIYGGPHVQLVSRKWALHANSRVRALNDAGFLVFVCDNRGSNRRGADFEGAMQRNMGDEEVKDQVEGVKYLVSQKLTIPGKVGCFGWSYGGYMTCMCLARAPEVFSVGVAGAPVTHWDGYDTHYTERYMGTPQNNPDGYQVSSVMHHAHKITGQLMLIHGLIDENVHFRHTARLINSLIEGNIPYRLLLFPCERHSPRKPQDHVYMANHINQFFTQHLK